MRRARSSRRCRAACAVALLQAAQAVAGGGFGLARVLRAGAIGVGGASAAKSHGGLRRHVLRVAAHVHRGALSIDRQGRHVHLARCPVGARRPGRAAGYAAGRLWLVVLGLARAARAPCVLVVVGGDLFSGVTGRLRRARFDAVVRVGCP